MYPVACLWNGFYTRLRKQLANGRLVFWLYVCRTLTFNKQHWSVKWFIALYFLKNIFIVTIQNRQVHFPVIATVVPA